MIYANIENNFYGYEEEQRVRYQKLAVQIFSNSYTKLHWQAFVSGILAENLGSSWQVAIPSNASLLYNKDGSRLLVITLSPDALAPNGARPSVSLSFKDSIILLWTRWHNSKWLTRSRESSRPYHCCIELRYWCLSLRSVVSRAPAQTKHVSLRSCVAAVTARSRRSEKNTKNVRLNLMMTSSNGNIFHVTGPLCGEFTGHSSQRPVARSFDVFFDLRLE